MDKTLSKMKQYWLTHPGSLSSALEKASAKPCTVLVQQEGWLQPWQEEKAYLYFSSPSVELFGNVHLCTQPPYPPWFGRPSNAQKRERFGITNDNHSRYWIREVIIATHQPAVFARSVFPESLLQHFPEFLDLGGQVLGRRLFADETFKRGPIDVIELHATHLLWQKIPIELRIEPCWARRSLFHSLFGSLLVSEVFLPYVTTL